MDLNVPFYTIILVTSFTFSRVTRVPHCITGSGAKEIFFWQEKENVVQKTDAFGE